MRWRRGRADALSTYDARNRLAESRLREIALRGELAEAVVALELARSKELDDELAHRFEQVAIKLEDLDALAVVHDIIGGSLSGSERADEYVRQAEIMLKAGADALDAIQHGEVALAGIDAAQAQELLPRLAELTEAPGHIIDLYERQVARCKKPGDRVEALARAAQVAAKHGAVERARDFFNAALSGGVQEATLTALEQAARNADEAAGGAGTVLRTLAEAPGAGGRATGASREGRGSGEWGEAGSALGRAMRVGMRATSSGGAGAPRGRAKRIPIGWKMVGVARTA